MRKGRSRKTRWSRPFERPTRRRSRRVATTHRVIEQTIYTLAILLQSRPRKAPGLLASRLPPLSGIIESLRFGVGGVDGTRTRGLRRDRAHAMRACPLR